MKKNKYRYMLINYVQKAKYPKRTHEKGYWSNPDNIQWDEVVEFRIGLKTKEYQNYSVIIGLDELSVIKNSLNGEKNFIELYSYYREHYAQQIDNYLKQTSNVVSAQ